MIVSQATGAGSDQEQLRQLVQSKVEACEKEGIPIPHLLQQEYEHMFPELPEHDPSIEAARASARAATRWMVVPDPSRPPASAGDDPTGEGGEDSEVVAPTEEPWPVSQWASMWPSRVNANEHGRRARFTSLALRVVYEAGRTGFEQEKDFDAKPGMVVAGRYQVTHFLGTAAFSRAVAAQDLVTGRHVCLKIVKNHKVRLTGPCCSIRSELTVGRLVGAGVL